eukprot:4904079-Ditylum_brightwellii.AAC.1
MELRKGMYGLLQAGILANKLLTTLLATKGYKPCCHTPEEEHAHHLLQTLRHWYEVAEDWLGERYCNITIEWDYEKGRVDLSIQ